jgi:hypothetical protein
VKTKAIHLRSREGRGKGVERETGAALCPCVRSPSAATEFSVRPIGLQMREAVLAVHSWMRLTINGGPDHHGDLDRRGGPDHDVPDPHDETIRRDRDRVLARQSIPLPT